MICPNCQKEIADGSLACPACGISFNAPGQPPVTVMPPAQSAPVNAKKPIYRKWWFWVLIVIVAIIAIASLGGSDGSETKTPSVSTNIADTSAGSTKAAAATTESSADTTTEDTSIVLYNKNDIVITYKSSGEDIFGKNFNILVENNSSKNITVSMDDVAIDGYTLSSFLYTQVSAGKKANDTFTIYDSELSKNEIDEIKSMEIKLSIINSDTFGVIDNSDTITLNF